MKQRLDALDVRILEGLGIYGPRDLMLLADKLDLNRGTVWKRVRHLSSLHLLRLHANVYHTNLGLKKAVVVAWAVPGKEDLLFDCLCVNDYRVYISRCFGVSEGCVAVYTIPESHIPEFKEFIGEIERAEVAKSVEMVWSTCFQSVNLTSNWFDMKSETWVFPWDEWRREVAREGTELPYTLVDPKEFAMKGDAMDLFILKELEKDAAIDSVDIAKKLGTSRQVVDYHYKTHVLKRGLIENVQVNVEPFDRKGMSEPVFLTLRFDDGKRLARFARSLLDKPFAHTVGKVLGEHALVAYLHFLSRKDFRSFMAALSRLVRDGLVRDYSFALLDLERTWRETVRHDLFKDKSWVYNHEEYLEKVRELVNKAEK
jgi:DNA-binding Lrp family transcriptional regulator